MTDPVRSRRPWLGPGPGGTGNLTAVRQSDQESLTPSTGAAAPLRPQTLRPTPLTEVAALLGLPLPAGPDVSVTGVTHDSRAIRPGDFYAALPGSRAHGADFAAQAAANGAV